jgi:hypothetical protein
VPGGFAWRGLRHCLMIGRAPEAADLIADLAGPLPQPLNPTIPARTLTSCSSCC